MKSIFLIALVSLGVSSTGLGVTITNPLSLSTQFVAGIHNGQQGSSNVAAETAIAQAILDLGLGQTSGFNQSNTVFNYSGTITSTGGQISTGFDGVGGVAIPAGWGGALAKYDGPNAGYVLYVFGGQASVIPEFPWNFWTNQTDQYQISHYTLFSGSVDIEPRGVVPEGGVGMALFGMVLAGMGLFRKVLGSLIPA
jgi:hypothetical protein